ncbi:TPA: hypothetical protein ACF2WO_003144 [Escherichia coli]
MSALWLNEEQERALHGFTITSEDLSGVVNALSCCANKKATVAT